MYEDKRWDYDNFGNVTAKHIARHTTQQFRWNAEHQLAQIEDSLDEFQAEYYKSLINILTDLKKTEVFYKNDFMLFISVSDDDSSEEVQNHSVQLLNYRDIYMKF
ncbi:DUF4303 domain-containing protein [Cronobacter turicensis]|nr:DUF4303 domain-containing protein [Cronobacter turicensis]